MSTAPDPKRTAVKALMLDTRGEFFNWHSKVNRPGRHWEILRVDSYEAMLSFLHDSSYQAIIVAASTRVHADHDCLIKAMGAQPRAVRIFLPGMPMSTLQWSRTQDLVHRAFSEGHSLEDIVDCTETLIKINRLLHKETTRKYILSLGTLPSPPRIFQELNNALNSDQSNAGHISRIIGQDPALAAKVLSVVNSAYFGLNRSISSIMEAVTLLGMRMLRALTLSGHLVSLYPQQRSWSYFSFDSMNQRATLVARLADQICRDLDTSQAIREQAFIAGLLHDLGILIMASQDPQLYRKIIVESAQKQTHLCQVEKRTLGFYHGEVAAYLLDHWKLPAAISEAVLLHHTPQLSPGSMISPLTAVHIADSLLPDADTEVGANLSNSLSLQYLKRLGLENEVPRWRVAAVQLSRAVT